MKDLRPGLFAFLRDDAVIGPLVTTGGVARVYPVRLPQGIKLASIVYTRISGQGDYTMAGASGYARPRYQIDAWSPDPDAAGRLANAVKAALDGFTGAIGTGANAVFVQGVFIADEREDYDDTVQMYRVSRDYFIHHEER
jgi:Protein of unknown function (DUF3168)